MLPLSRGLCCLLCHLLFLSLSCQTLSWATQNRLQWSLKHILSYKEPPKAAFSYGGLLPHPESFQKHSAPPLNESLPFDRRIARQINRLTDEEFKNLKDKGFFEGDPSHWKNWHLLNKGQWEDPGVKRIPKMASIRQLVEPKMKREPLDRWDTSRGIDYNVEHYPNEYDFWNATLGDREVYLNKTYRFPPLQFSPGWFPKRDRSGLQYGDARLFEGWNAWDPLFALRVEEATDITIIPQTGHRWQKFYIGPLPETMGWTIGALLQTMGQSRSPGHAVVALKAIGRFTNGTIEGVQEDLLELSLNMKDIALQTLTPEMEGIARVKARGPMMLTAGMIEWPEYVKLMNPEQYIATIEEGGELDLMLKLEWGRGHWLADLEGLVRREEGVRNVGYKRRRIKEVDKEGFHPCSCVFGACRMIRLAVHKLLGSRWDRDRNICPNPKEQLVVEIWSDAAHTPKEILSFALQESFAWMAELRRQIVEDVDWQHEEDELKATWTSIDSYRLMKHQQQLLGGPPIEVFGSDVLNLTRKEPIETSTKAFSLPNLPPIRPVKDGLQWLREELEREPYAESKAIKAEDVEPFIRPDNSNGPASVLIEEMKLPKACTKSFLESGIHTLADVLQYTQADLAALPNVDRDSITFLAHFLKKKFDIVLPPE